MELLSGAVGIIIILLVIYVFVRILMKPIKIIWKLLLNSGIGLLLIVIVNYIGQYFAFSLPLNIINVLIAGFLGIPGIIILIGIDVFMH